MLSMNRLDEICVNPVRNLWIRQTTHQSQARVILCPLTSQPGSHPGLLRLQICVSLISRHDSAAGERMYRTACPLHGPGHDSLVGERMYLTVYPPCDPVMIAQWENEYISLSVLPVTWVQFPTVAGYFQGWKNLLKKSGWVVITLHIKNSAVQP